MSYVTARRCHTLRPVLNVTSFIGLYYDVFGIFNTIIIHDVIYSFLIKVVFMKISERNLLMFFEIVKDIRKFRNVLSH